jgi:predicted  nucleic acid-binding Zn-ribbon protein
MSDTPRTDAAEHNMGSIVEPHYVVDADFSRYLERELVDARAELAETKKELNDKNKFCYAVEQALDGLKGDYVEIIKELRKDAERYQWLRDKAQNTMKKQRAWLASNELDAAIDAAMKEGGK